MAVGGWCIWSQHLAGDHRRLTAPDCCPVYLLSPGQPLVLDPPALVPELR